MAGRKNNTKKDGRASGKANKSAGKPLGFLFWPVFFIVITGLFLANRNRIQDTLENTRIIDHLPVSLPRIGGRERAEEPEAAPVPAEPAQPKPTGPETNPEAGKPATPAVNLPAAGPPITSQPATSQPATIQPVTDQPVAREPVANRPATSQPAISQPETPPVAANSPETRPRSPQTPAARTTPLPPAPVERAVYFARIDAEGTILRTRVIRRLPSSDSPLMDSLRALIAGPNAEEERQGLRSLIPSATRLLPATTVRGSTAYISFSEDFQYNTFGVEGYAAQLRQVIWTATEFPNVKDVQILIEGRRIDYLGEGIWIGSPLNRESL
ncbi:MAG: GerMN domain-containing protein [Treponema sp.]|nr:GerMN domain-containing protein [Treponema sp.]